ncbi:MAG: tRNA uridine-5-carboxymethylaminomethyl(34) synthesis GTPase MnmE [Candidatus Omnitrophota bacterium]|jgi:tRNA modification GTPase
MLLQNDSDTIAAIATPCGEAGIAIIRVSGRDALSVADRVFLPAEGKKPSSSPGYSLNYGWIVSRRDPEDGGQSVDEVLLGVMRAPRSYTREDVVEINCHGGAFSVRRILDILLKSGCRLAAPGEFTKRAFLNGRIDLTQAEAVMEVIGAKTEAASRSGIMQLKGGLSSRITPLRAALLDLLAGLEATIDFPEEEAYAGTLASVTAGLEKIIKGIRSLIETSRCGIPLSEGASVVICGRPNTGKSSLLNALLKKERSIVTPLAGTTRDTVEEAVDIKGIPVRLIDTAGIKEPDDIVEKKAVLRSRRYIDSGDLVVLLFDGGKKLGPVDKALIRKLRGKKNVLAVVNKCDLKQLIETGLLEKEFGNSLSVSARKGINIGLLEEKIAGKIFKGGVPEGESLFVSNRRHLELLRQAEKYLCEAFVSCVKDISPELAAQDIRDALGNLDSILGFNFSDDVLKRIFSRFCIGK